MKSPKVKTLSKDEGGKLGILAYPNFHITGSITGMRKQYYGKDALLVRCGSYVYNVTAKPEIYYAAH